MHRSRRWTAIACALALAACSDEPASSDSSDAIVGGHAADPQSVMPATGLLDVAGTTCTATLIDASSLSDSIPEYGVIGITAAHCLKDDGATYRFWLGSRTNGHWTPVAVAVGHPRFDNLQDPINDWNLNDVAVFFMAAPVGVKPAILGAPVNGTGIVIGYGRSSNAVDSGGDRKFLDVSVVTTPASVGSDFVEIRSNEGSTCFGDSGGPLVQNQRLVAIDSRKSMADFRSAQGPCHTGARSFFTNLNKHRDFIAASVECHARNPDPVALRSCVQERL